MTQTAKDGNAAATSPQIDIEQFKQLWFSLTPISIIAEVFHVNKNALYTFARRNNIPTNRQAAVQNHELKKDRRRREIKEAQEAGEDIPDDTPDPTPSEIEERAAQIRAGWTPEQRRRSVTRVSRRVEIKNYVFDGRHTAFEYQER